MLSKAELNERYEECLREFTIRRDANEKKFSEGYLAKALHNLELAGVLDILSRNDDKKRAIEIPSTSQYFDWIIITSYYSMYLAATAALSKIGIKSTTHGSTIIALKYWYCFKKNLLERKYIQMIENANFGKEDIQKIEIAYAERGFPVISNNSAHRWTLDVPMIIPEINPQHLDIIPIQKKNHGWNTGFIIVKPNCSIQSYVPILSAWKRFEPQEVVVSTYQAISGAGKTFKTWPEMVDNCIPYISGEEEKSEKEPSKIWGKIKIDKFVLTDIPKISANCIRVPVSDGHMAAINVRFAKKVSKEKLIESLNNFKNPLDKLDLPSAPKRFLTYFGEDNRPQTRLDRDLGNGMGISVGRIRKDSVLDWKCVALSHNTIRGAAGGSILNAELLVKKGYIMPKM